MTRAPGLSRLLRTAKESPRAFVERVFTNICVENIVFTIASKQAFLNVNNVILL